MFQLRKGVRFRGVSLNQLSQQGTRKLPGSRQPYTLVETSALGGGIPSTLTTAFNGASDFIPRFTSATRFSYRRSGTARCCFDFDTSCLLLPYQSLSEFLYV